MQSDEIIVVTGLPRSGTTCMMRMLEAGGVPLYYESDKPLEFWKGGVNYINYNVILRESEKLKQLKAGDCKWIKQCVGHAVKILTPAKTRMPKGPSYRFIWMDRKAKHCANSNRKFMNRCGQERMNPDMADRVTSTDKTVLMAYIAEQKERGILMLRSFPRSNLLIVKFEDMIKAPRLVVHKVTKFLKIKNADKRLMANVVVKRPQFCLPNMLEEEIYT